MTAKAPEILLILYMLLPMKSSMIAQIILSQIRGIYISRQAERKLNLDLDNKTDTDETLGQFLSAFWFDPDNRMTCAYLGLLNPMEVEEISQSDEEG
jgi:hypothetical protein